MIVDIQKNSFKVKRIYQTFIFNRDDRIIDGIENSAVYGVVEIVKERIEGIGIKEVLFKALRKEVTGFDDFGSFENSVRV